MSLDPSALSGPLVGQPQQVGHIQQNPDGSKHLFPYVATALFGDHAIEQLRIFLLSRIVPALVEQIRKVVRDELDLAKARAALTEAEAVVAGEQA
jgi:hypothetical protein